MSDRVFPGPNALTKPDWMTLGRRGREARGEPFRRLLRGWFCILVLGGLTATVWAQGQPPATAPAKPEAAKPEAAKPDAAPAKAEGPASHTVSKGLLRITVDLEGAFEARSAAEVIVRLDEYLPVPALTVVNVAKHGARVKKGDVLLTLDTDKIDKLIADLATDVKLGELSLAQSEQNLQALEKLTPLDLAANLRDAKILEEDRKYYFDIVRPFQLNINEFELKQAKDYLEYAQEELDQLEKMYQADEVTEETEAIVLKRARDQLESTKLMVEVSQVNHDFTLKYDLPRRDERVKDTSQRKQLDLERAKIILPQLLQRSQLEVEKSRVQQRRSAERLEDLKADRQKMTVLAAAEGVVYYGKSSRGKFSDAQAAGELLRPGGMVQINQVIMTVVQPDILTIRATVAEKELHRLRPGLSGVATPAAYPDMKLNAVLTQWSEIPVGPGSFDATLQVNLDKKTKTIVPGMSCKVKLNAYLKKDALTVPVATLMTDEADDRQYVWLLGKDNKPARRYVTVGPRSDKSAEIAQGLAAGDKVLLEAPKDAK